MASGPGPPRRPVAVDLAALILVAGGLIGLSQLVVGTYVITGSLPAKAPILGVAFGAYVLAVAVGLVVRTGRAWLGGLNLAVVVALLYLPAAERPLILGLVIGHAVAATALLVGRPWFTAVAAWRRGGPMPPPTGAS